MMNVFFDRLPAHVINALQRGEVCQYSDCPQGDHRLINDQAGRQNNEPLHAGEDAYFGVHPNRLGARADVRYHHRSGSREKDQDTGQLVLLLDEINHQSQENNQLRIAVSDRIDKGAKIGWLTAQARHRAIQSVDGSHEQDDDSTGSDVPRCQEKSPNRVPYQSNYRDSIGHQTHTIEKSCNRVEQIFEISCVRNL